MMEISILTFILTHKSNTGLVEYQHPHKCSCHSRITCCKIGEDALKLFMLQKRNQSIIH